MPKGKAEMLARETAARLEVLGVVSREHRSAVVATLRIIYDPVVKRGEDDSELEEAYNELVAESKRLSVEVKHVTGERNDLRTENAALREFADIVGMEAVVEYPDAVLAAMKKLKEATDAGN